MTNFWKRVKNVTNDPVLRLKGVNFLDKSRDLFDKASNIAEFVKDIGPNPTPGKVVIQSVITLNKMFGNYYFDPENDLNFKIVYLGSFTGYFFGVLRADSRFKSIGSAGNPVYLGKIDNETIVMTGPTKDNCRFYYLDQGVENISRKILQMFGRIVWENCGSKISLVSKKNDNIEFISLHLSETFKSSEQAKNLKVRLSKFVSKEFPRSILLYGNPGVGKSYMAQDIVNSLGGLTLFIESSEIPDLDTSKIQKCLDMLCPDGVIIDDIDRIEDKYAVLSLVENIRKATKCFVATANYIENFDPAIKRAGRFDEVIEVIRSVAPSTILPSGISDEVIKEVDSWPIAYVQELKARLEVLGVEVLEEEMNDLRPRVQNNSTTISRKSSASEEDFDPFEAEE